MVSESVSGVCPQCGVSIPARQGGRGRPRVWCSPRCRKRAHDARRVAEEGSLPIRVVTVATERTKYVRVPLRELRNAVRDSPEIAVEFAEAVKWIASEEFQYPGVRERIQNALHAAGVATVQNEINAVQYRIEQVERDEQRLKASEARLREREAQLREREAELGRREAKLARSQAATSQGTGFGGGSFGGLFIRGN